MELASYLEIIVLVAIIIELISLVRHTKFQREFDEHVKRLDDHIIRLNKQLENNTIRTHKKEEK